MKASAKVLISLFIMFVITAIFPKQSSAQQDNVSFQVFYDELSPFGSWVNYSDYGYVWIPDAGPDFEPYLTEGHWIFTDYGWTWMSDYSWGWAPFHYGRWDYDQNFGWFWVPGNEWGPAWVTWRRADGYYGWAPMEPGISISISFNRPYDRNRDHWFFVRDRDFDRSDINHYYIGRSDEDRIIQRSTVINNTYNDNRRNTTYIAGPDRNDFQRSTGKQVNPVIIQEYNKPGQNLSNGRLQIYKPEVIKNNDRTTAPSRVTNLNEISKPSERRTTNPNGNVNPPDNSRREGQPDRVNRTQPPNTNPPKNSREVTHQDNIKSQNSNPPDNVRKDVRQDNVKPPENTPQNIRKEAPPVDVKQPNNNQPQNIRREAPPVDVKQPNNNQPQNIRKEAPPVNVKQPDNNQPQNIKKDNQQNNTNAPKTNRSDNTRRDKSNSAKSSAKDKKDQKKKSEDSKKDE
jgi:hypothetical protein